MVKIQVNSQGKAYYTNAGKVLLAPEGGGEQIEATNNTGAAITSGDKVWINESGNEYELVNYYSSIPNFDIIGSPIITNRVVSGFSANNYLQLPYPFNPGNNSWEIDLKVNVGSGDCFFFGNTNGSYSIVLGRFYGILMVFLSSNNSYWDIANVLGNLVLEDNKEYFIRLSYDLISYKLEASSDGITWQTSALMNSSKKIYQSTLYLGSCWDRESSYCNGSIDLSESYIKINNKIWWAPYATNITSDTQTGTAAENIVTGATGLVNVGAVIKPIGSITITENGTHDVTDYAEAVVIVTGGGDVITAQNNTGSNISEGDKVWINESNGSYSIEKLKEVKNFNVNGNPTINDDTGVISDFSSSNYLTLNDGFFPENNSWEYVVHFKTGNNISADQSGIFIVDSLFIGNGGDGHYLVSFLQSNPSSWDIANGFMIMPISALTEYWIKLEFTGTAYNYYSSSNGGASWNLVNSINTTSKIYGYATPIIGTNGSHTVPFLGEIYIKDCYIKVNNELWWEPYLLTVTTDTQTGIAAENIATGSTGLVNVASGVS